MFRYVYIIELQLLQDSFTFFIYNFLLNVFELISHYNRVTDVTVIVTNVTLVTFMNTLNILDHFYALSPLWETCETQELISRKCGGVTGK